MENLCQRIILLFICRGISRTQIRGCCPILSVHFHVSWLSVFTTVSMWNELTLAYSDRKCESTVPSRYISPSQTNGSGCRYSVEASPRTGIPVNRRSTGRVSRCSMGEQHRRNFDIKDDILRVENDPDDESRLNLTINRKPIADWFREQWHRLRYGARVPQQEERKSRGFKL